LKKKRNEAIAQGDWIKGEKERRNGKERGATNNKS